MPSTVHIAQKQSFLQHFKRFYREKCCINNRYIGQMVAHITIGHQKGGEKNTFHCPHISVADCAYTAIAYFITVFRFCRTFERR